MCAKITYSPLIAEARGSIGGVCFSHNTSGNFARIKNMPCLSNSVKLSLQKIRFAFLANVWKGLTSSQRATWYVDCKQRYRSDSLGNYYPFSAFNYFLSVNLKLLSIDSSPVWSSPVIPQLRLNYITAAVAKQSSFVVSFYRTSAHADYPLTVFASAPVSAGRNSFNKSDFRIIGTYPSYSGGAQDIYTDYRNIFGSLGDKVGQAIAVGSYETGDTSGKKSKERNSTVIVINCETD